MRTRPPPRTEAAFRDAGLVPWFQPSDFFDARDVRQVKYKMRYRVSVDVASKADAVTQFGASWPNIDQAEAAFDRDGLAGLVSTQRGPTGCASSTSRRQRSSNDTSKTTMRLTPVH